MKAILEFDLPEDQPEFDLVNKASNMSTALWDIDNFCRNAIKHGHNYDTVEDALEVIRSMVSDYIE